LASAVRLFHIDRIGSIVAQLLPLRRLSEVDSVLTLICFSGMILKADRRARRPFVYNLTE